MSKILGLDFGTTNSTISYYDKRTKTLDGFRHNASSNDYIPTIVAYDTTKEHDIYIGDEAKENLTEEYFDVYENFKLLLGKKFNTIIEGRTKKPIQVTHDFIHNLLEVYKNSQRITDIEGIIMTVPETWFREASNQTARENIEEIFRKLGYGETEFLLESEPVAAAAYFCWDYERSQVTFGEKKYHGFITVIDYGGGTLDVTLCEATIDGKIRVLERCGFGEYNDTNGCAGVAFDEAVVERLIFNNDLSIRKDSAEFIELRVNFERKKIITSRKITERLIDYYDDPDIIEEEILFSLKLNSNNSTVDVRCDDLVQCFNKINLPKLKQSLEQIKQCFYAHNVDSSTQDNFRVLLVGGFSNFYAVEKEVREFFGSKPGNIDKRFEQLSIQNRALAISRGAALIAEKEIITVHACTHSYGYVVFEIGETDHPIPKYIPVIKKGADIKALSEPVFADSIVRVKPEWTDVKLRIFIDDGRPNNEGRQRIALDESVKEIFPSIDDNNEKKYQIGFSISKNQIPTIHIKDEFDSVKSTSLHKLIERIAITE